MEEILKLEDANDKIKIGVNGVSYTEVMRETEKKALKHLHYQHIL